ncbi:MAG: GTP-binding protein [Proteobacteria bacterium]|nr:GTP-binding protein [Pseudomonadota bacterium]
MKGKTPVALLTGFLGSGKTTLLSRVLNQGGFKDTAVIVNEFGEVSIDHLVVADLAENILELRDGCLCCTIRGDLAMTLRDLNRRRYLEEIPYFSRVIVETTGLADPVPLVHTMMANAPIQSAYRLDAVVCVVDGEHGVATLAAHDTAQDQVAMADVLVISKIDIASSAALAALRARLADINAGAEVVEVANGDIDAARLFGRALFAPGARDEALARWMAHAHEHHDHGARYTAHVIRHDGPLSLAGTSVFLNRIVNEMKDDILRIKGIAGFREKGGKPAIVHGVQNKFYPVAYLDAWPDEDHTSRLVFIGRQLDTQRIDELFAGLCI